MKLPVFKYHPDPLATGSIMQSDKKCRCCGRTTGFIYAGPVYAEDELDQAICPWCIADGSAAEKFEATFTDESGIGDGEVTVTAEVEEEVARRTPGFSGWQQERWLGYCDDAAAFLGPAGRQELEQLGSKAVEAVRQECGLEGGEWKDYLKSLDRDKGPTAYVFRCQHCGKLKAYSDCA
jgi:uncharacterized protein CbrC (UPF0167 family)